MLPQFTAAAKRVLIHASYWSDSVECDELEAIPLLVGLLAESECRAAVTLSNLGINLAVVEKNWQNLRQIPISTEGCEQRNIKPLAREVKIALELARQRLASLPQPQELATEHILLGLALADNEASRWLREKGLNADVLAAEIHKLHGCEGGTAPTIVLDNSRELTAPGESAQLDQADQENTKIFALRALDAAANRASEALRVVEDYVRFVLDDRHLTELCKRMRHDLAAVLASFSSVERLAARETQADVGITLSTASERRRDGTAAVLAANFARLQESLRSLEEFSKLADAGAADAFKQLRYRSYTLHRAVEITRRNVERLAGARLYVLIDGRGSMAEFEQLACSLVNAGVHILQLRDKHLDDRCLLHRARILQGLTRETTTLFIVNDRPDIAVLSGADGVHLGQEDLSVKDARSIVGPDRLIGVSAHDIDQARQAVLDGADYIGCGPTFPSETKQFERFPGVEFLRSVAAEIRLPAFAIGGIDLENAPKVFDVGFTRIAVSRAVTVAENPAQAAKNLLALL